MRLTVNGSAYDIDAPDHETLLTTLRERLQLTGTKLVCGRGECGACSVHLDGALAYACLTLTRACEGVAVTTIEGVSRDGGLHPVQEAFVAHDALQCGFCTPGQVMAALALLETDPRPSDDAIRRGMSGNLCRCGAYPKILAAIRAVGSEDKHT